MRSIRALALLAPLWGAAAAWGETAEGPPIAAFARLPALNGPTISPDGRHLAMLHPHEGRYHPVLIALDEGGRPVRRLRIEPGEHIEDFVNVAWSGNRWLLIGGLGRRPFQSMPDNRLLIFDVERRRLYPAVRPPRAGGHSLRAKTASKLRRPSVRLVDPLRFRPARALVMVTGLEADGTQLWRLDLKSRSFDVVLDNGARHLSLDADAQGVLRLTKSAPQGRPEIFYRETPDDGWQNLTPPLDPDAGDRVAGLTGDGEALWVLRPAQGRGRRLYRFEPGTESFSGPLFGPTKQDVESLLFDEGRGRRRLIGYRAQGAFERDVYLDPAWSDRQRRIDTRLPESANRIVSSSETNDRHILIAERSDRPRHYYIYDETTKTLTELGSAYPELAAHALAQRRELAYPARDGTLIPAYLTMPLAGDPPFPAVVLVHGGPQSRVNAAFRYWPAFLASRGYLVLEPNFRGSSGYGEAWEAAGRGEWGALMQEDVADGANWLLEEELARAGGLCIMGGSYGGYAALMGAAETPELFACAVAVNAVSDLERMVRDDRRMWPGAPWTRYIGDDAAGANRLAAASPVTRAGRIDAPVLLVHAEDDLRVPVDHSETMAGAIQSAGGRVELISLEAGGHPLVEEAARRKLLAALQTFLAARLEPDSTK